MCEKVIIEHSLKSLKRERDLNYFQDNYLIKLKFGTGGYFRAPYQAFYGLKHYNLLETGSFLIRKLNQLTSCLLLQFKGKNTLKLPFDSNFK